MGVYDADPARAAKVSGEPGVRAFPALEDLLGLEGWVRAVRGEGPLVVSGRDGRQALAVALEIMGRIEHDVAAWQPA